jgi:A/G-specific adenine glycosylase
MTNKNWLVNKIWNFQESMLEWYQYNGRNFPWRENSLSQYQLIIAEVFLQRTRAETVSAFYPTFLVKYPNWDELSYATEKELQEALKPLGLNNQRGTRLFNLAQEMKRRKGQFPNDRSEVEDMPMMGQYLTNAYELYFLKKRVPLLDVNMARVVERIFGPRKKVDIRFDRYLQDLAYQIVDHKDAKELNWAILDYAALVCKPIPYCEECIFVSDCLYFRAL